MSTRRRFDDKVVIVTGAAQGIGRGVALGVCRRGRHGAGGGPLRLVARSASPRSTLPAARRPPSRPTSRPTPAPARGGARRCERFGRVDVLINNVGGTIWAKPFEHYDEQRDRGRDPPLAVPHAVVLPRGAALHAREARRGVIVNVSSIATRGVHRVPYAAAKGGVNALTASLAMENAQHGIRVNATAPGGTEAPPRRIPRNTEQAAPTQEKRLVPGRSSTRPRSPA